MPVYEYRCPKGHVLDILCKYSEREEEIACALCSNLAKLILSTPALTPSRWGDYHKTYKGND
jgi:putative FmdB family regulatory protein